jgi:ABC-type sugar transport system permease subunit/ABC-type glycerol-3-phosphate transport system substrate-binding protein
MDAVHVREQRSGGPGQRARHSHRPPARARTAVTTTKRTAFTSPLTLFTAALLLATSACFAAAAETQPRPIQLRCAQVPTPGSPDINNIAEFAALKAFHDTYPDIRANSSTGLQLPGSQTMDMIPLMQIAGDIPEDALYVNFRQSDSYIRMKLLYPLDGYVEALAFTPPEQLGPDGLPTDIERIHIKNGHLMDTEAYFAEMAKAPNWEQIRQRVPHPCWPVIFRDCPYGAECEHIAARGAEPAPKHKHLWSYPIGPLVMGLAYRKDMFAEAELPERAPENWEELLDWGKKLTEPSEKRYGFRLATSDPGWTFLSFLYSTGGRIVEQDEEGVWRCVFNTPEAVEAGYFMARLRLERFRTAKGELVEGIAYMTSLAISDVRVGMDPTYMDQRSFMRSSDPDLYNIGPVPKGPTGIRGSEFNSMMLGVFAGLADQPIRRHAAWKYVQFKDGEQARRIRTRLYVENGSGRFVQPQLLERFGYQDLVRQVPPEWAKAYELALAGGVPEPYGKNCQLVYQYPSKALRKMWGDPVVKAAVNADPPDKEAAKARIQEIFTEFVEFGNREMLQIFTPQQKTVRTRTAWIVVIVTVIGFSYVFYRVFKVFTPEQLVHKGSWQLRRYAWCYILMAPALATILIWQYYPLARGSVMAFQDYNVRGFSIWVGMDNFAYALFDKKYWYSLLVSLKYAALYMTFAFFTPIFLAMLLQEIPRGKIVFRVIYYLPAVLSGAVVLFLWKSFYTPSGPVNDIVVFFVDTINTVFGSNIEFIRIDWLENSTFALAFCLIPTVWAGMGPGCLIYLAALKTVPEEIYEAADIDGAGIRQKALHIAMPSIKVLIMINFIFALIGAIRGSASFMLAMTGGGPYDEVYGATEVVGLQIFYTAFARLNFGLATAQAWILGTMLIGFTVYQLKRLSQVEFRTADTKE